MRRGTAAARRRAVRGHDPADPPALGPRAGAAVLRAPATATTRGSRCCCPSRRTAPRAEAVLARGMSPPHFPITPEWAARRVDVRHARAGAVRRSRASRSRRGRSRTRAAARSATGSATASSTLAYMPDHCPTVLGAGPGRLGRVPRGRASSWRQDADVLIHDASAAARGAGGARPRSATPPPTTRSALAARPDARRVVLFHHQPRPDRRRARRAAAAARRSGRSRSPWPRERGVSSCERASMQSSSDRDRTGWRRR